jgi:hypothetical protein
MADQIIGPDRNPWGEKRDSAWLIAQAHFSIATKPGGGSLKHTCLAILIAFEF